MLYATNIEDLATPVHKLPETSIKKSKKPEEPVTEAETVIPSPEPSEPEADPKELKKIEQKAARAAKAKAARLAKKEKENIPPPAPEPIPTPKVTKKRAPKKLDVTVTPPKTVDNDTPPAWFKSFMSNTRVEEAKISQPKKAQRTVRKEAAAEATQKWQEPEVRERVNHQQDQHMASMHKLYSQIFKR